MGKDEKTDIKKPELLNDILEETEELIKIFATSINTAVRQAHGPERSRRAVKKPRLGVVECSVLEVSFSFDVGRSMFDVHLSKQPCTAQM
jgi:hypothetical protein